MISKAATVDQYFEELPSERKPALLKLRETFRKNTPKGFEETIGYGMVGYVVPHSLYPDGYHCDKSLPLPFAGFASQKNFVAVYHMGIYSDPALLEWFTAEYAERVPGKLDMGKSCIRFKKPDLIPFDLIGELMSKMTVKEWISLYESEFKK